MDGYQYRYCQCSQGFPGAGQMMSPSLVAPEHDQVELAKWVIETQHQSVWPEATLKRAAAIIAKALS